MSAPSVHAQHLGFSYDASTVILVDVSFHLARGWTALTGPNGAGKTTLLRLLRRELEPTAGQLRFEPPDARVTWCAQRVEQLDPEVEAFADARDGAARKLHGRLQLEPWALQRWATLSPGERKRWQVGAALWAEPEVLLLDEPTNHLDAGATALLRHALEGFHGVGVLVSHDRALLDAMTSVTLRLDEGALDALPLPWSQAQAQWTAEREQLRAQRSQEKRKLERTLASLDTKRREHASSSQWRSTGARMKSRKDSDARTLMANYSAETAQNAHAAALRRLERKASQTEHALSSLQVRDAPGQDLFVRFEPCPRCVVAQVDGPLTLEDGTVLQPRVTLSLEREAHLWLRGKNGAGKTTLLERLLRESQLPDARVLWLPQELSLGDTAADLALLHALPPAEKGRVMQLVHALGVEPERLLASARPSPGESRKLRLALGLGKNVWLAALDEPTNHLDLPSIERLEAALRAFPGALVLVTHDEAFGAAVSTTTVTLGP